MSLHRADSIWLIKSGDRIVGPLTRDEVTRKLYSKEVVVIDEIITPGTRWRYIRDEPLFAVVVEDIRKAGLQSREDTEVGSNSTQTASATAELTASVTDLSDDTVTPVDINGPDIPESLTIKDAEVFEEKDFRPRSEAGGQAVRQYGFGDDRVVQEQIRRSSKLIWVLTAVVVVGAVFLVHYFQSGRNKGPQPTEYGQLYDRARLAYERGDFANALKLLRDARTLRSDDPDVNVLIAPLLLKNNETVEATTILQTTLGMAHQEEYRRPGYTALGLAALMEGDYAKAKEQLRNVIAMDQSNIPVERRKAGYIPAAYNLGVTHFLARDYGEAASLFELVARDDQREPVSRLMLVRTYLANGDKALTQAQQTLRDVLGRFQDFRQEAIVMMAYVHLRLGERRIIDERITKAMEADPFLTAEHWRDPLMYIEPLAWRHLVPLCKELHEMLSERAPIPARASDRADALRMRTKVKAFYGLCLLKAGNTTEAQPLIQDAVSKSPNDALLQSVQAYQLMAAGEDEKALGVLKLAAENNDALARENRYLLPYILRGRACLRLQQLDCAKESFAKSMELGAPSVAALAGQAEIAIREGRSEDAQRMIRTALEISPRHIPTMRLMEMSVSP